jgi:hypothetical protein
MNCFLRLQQDRAEDILGGAIARYLDDRFSVTNKRTREYACGLPQTHDPWLDVIRRSTRREIVRSIPAGVAKAT